MCMYAPRPNDLHSCMAVPLCQENCSLASVKVKLPVSHTMRDPCPLQGHPAQPLA